MLLESPKATTTGGALLSSPKARSALILALLCLPSLLFVWWNRDVPHFGVMQDDGLYYGSAKSLTEGSGYRIVSIPSTPYQTRYPPLYPLLLSLAWRINPSYPENLPLAALLSWLCLPAVVFLLYRWCLRQQFPAPLSWLVVSLFALNPYVLFFVSNLISEIFFMIFVFGAMWAAERGDSRGDPRGEPQKWLWPLLAGGIAGAAYLTRTAGITLLPAAILYYAWKKNFRAAFWFTLGMLPALAGWALWTRAHFAPGRDIVTLCYTNYVAYYLANISWDSLGEILWNNVDALLLAMGSLVVPQMLVGLPAKLILQPLGVAMILGCVRMVRKGHARFYALFGGTSVVLLLLWHFQPNQRFILPLAPLFLAGFCCEMAHLAALFQKAFHHRDRSQRVVAYGFAGLLGAILLGGLGLQVYMALGMLPELVRNDRANAAEFERTYQWIARNLPAQANVMWENDTALYFGSGRYSTNFMVPPRTWYATGGDNGEAGRYRNIDDFARQHHLDYIAIAKIGLHRNADVLAVVASNPNLERVHEDAGAILYRVRPTAVSLRQ